MNNPTANSDKQLKANLARLKALYGQSKYKYADVNKADYLEERYGLDWNKRLKDAMSLNASPENIAKFVTDKTFTLPEAQPLTLADAQTRLDATLEEDETLAQNLYDASKGASRSMFSALESPVQTVQNLATQFGKKQSELRGEGNTFFSTENVPATLEALKGTPGYVFNTDTYSNTDLGVQITTALDEGFAAGFSDEATGSGFFIDEKSKIGLEKEKRALDQWTLANGQAATPGRAFANGLGIGNTTKDLANDSAAYTFVSGLTDFLTVLFADPLNLIPVGKTGSISKASKLSSLADKTDAGLLTDLSRIDVTDIPLTNKGVVDNNIKNLDEAKVALADELFNIQPVKDELYEVIKNKNKDDEEYTEFLKDNKDKVLRDFIGDLTDELTSEDPTNLAAKKLMNDIPLETKGQLIEYINKLASAEVIARSKASLEKKAIESIDETKYTKDVTDSKNLLKNKQYLDSSITKRKEIREKLDLTEEDYIALYNKISAKKEDAASKTKHGTDPEDYRMGHQASPEDSAPGNDIEYVYPDFFTNPSMYALGGNDTSFAESLKVITEMKGNPDKVITVYRNVPKDSNGKINPGDWVSTSKTYAKNHNPDGIVVETKVKASDIFNEGNSIDEWSYHPAVDTKQDIMPTGTKAKGYSQYVLSKDQELKLLEEEFNSKFNKTIQETVPVNSSQLGDSILEEIRKLEAEALDTQDHSWLNSIGNLQARYKVITGDDPVEAYRYKYNLPIENYSINTEASALMDDASKFSGSKRKELFDNADKDFETNINSILDELSIANKALDAEDPSNMSTRFGSKLAAADLARKEFVDKVAEVTGKNRELVDLDRIDFKQLQLIKAGVTDNAVNFDTALSYLFGDSKTLNRLYEVTSSVKDKYTIWKMFGSTLDDKYVRSLSKADNVEDVRTILSTAMLRGDIDTFNKRHLKKLLFKNSDVTDYVNSPRYQKIQALRSHIPVVNNIDYDNSASVLKEVEQLIDFTWGTAKIGKDKNYEKVMSIKKDFIGALLEAQTASQRKQVYMTHIDKVIKKLGVENYPEDQQKIIIDRVKRDIGYNTNKEELSKGYAQRHRTILASSLKGEARNEALDVGKNAIEYSDNEILTVEKLNFTSPSLDVRALKKAINAGLSFEDDKVKYVKKNSLLLFNEAYDRYVKPAYLVARLAYPLLNVVEGSTRNFILGYSNIFNNPSIALHALSVAFENPDSTIGRLASKLSKKPLSVDEYNLFKERGLEDDVVYATRRLGYDELSKHMNSSFAREFDKSLDNAGGKRAVDVETTGYDTLRFEDYIDVPGKHKEYFDAIGSMTLARSLSDEVFNVIVDSEKSLKKLGQFEKFTGTKDNYVINPPSWLTNWLFKVKEGNYDISDKALNRIKEMFDDGTTFVMPKKNEKYVVIKDDAFKDIVTMYVKHGPAGKPFEQLWGARYSNVPGSSAIDYKGKFTYSDIRRELFGKEDGTMHTQTSLLTDDFDNNIIEVLGEWRRIHALRDSIIDNRSFWDNRRLRKNKDITSNKEGMSFEIDGVKYTYDNDSDIANIISSRYMSKHGTYDSNGKYTGINKDSINSIPAFVSKKELKDVPKEKFNFLNTYENIIMDLLTLASEPEKLLAHQPFLVDAYIEGVAKRSMMMLPEEAYNVAKRYKEYYKGRYKTKRIKETLIQLDNNARKSKLNFEEPTVGYKGLTSHEVHVAASKDAMRSIETHFYGVNGRNQYAAKFSIFAPFIQAAVNTGLFYSKNTITKPSTYSKLNKAQIAWSNLQSEDTGVLREYVPGLSKGEGDRRPLVWVNDFGDKLVTIPFMGFDVNTAMWNPLTYTDNPMQVLGPGVSVPATMFDNVVHEIPQEFRSLMLGNTQTDPTRDVSTFRELTPSVVQQAWKVWESTSMDHIGSAFEAVIASDPDKYLKYTQDGTPYLDDDGKNRALEDAKMLSLRTTLWQQVRTNLLRGGTSQENIIPTITGSDLSVQVLLDEFHTKAAESPNGKSEAYKYILDKYGPGAVTSVISVNKPAFDGSSKAYDFAIQNPDLFDKAEDTLGLFFPNKTGEPDSNFARLVNDKVYTGGVKKTPEELQGEVNLAFLNAEKARILEKYKKGYITEDQYDMLAERINSNYEKVKKSDVETYNTETYTKLLELSNDPRLADTDTAKAFKELHSIRTKMFDAGLVSGKSFAGASEQEQTNREVMRRVGEELVKKYPGFTNAWFYALRSEYNEE